MNILVWKRIHNLLGLASALFLLILLGTGILLNHPSVFKSPKTEVISMDPTQAGHWLSGRKDGLYVSNDGGKTWDEASMLYPPQDVVDIVFVPGRAGHVYLVERWGKILHSSDGGRVWNALETPFDPQTSGVELKRLSSDGKNGLALLTSHGWLDSSDGGKTWDDSRFNPESRPAERLVKTLHNGYFFGPSFVWVYDASAIALLILIITGVVLWRTGKKAA